MADPHDLPGTMSPPNVPGRLAPPDRTPGRLVGSFDVSLSSIAADLRPAAPPASSVAGDQYRALKTVTEPMSDLSGGIGAAAEYARLWGPDEGSCRGQPSSSDLSKLALATPSIAIGTPVWVLTAGSPWLGQVAPAPCTHRRHLYTHPERS